MIKRYTPEKIGSIWSETSKFNRFLEIEILVVEALAKLGKVPLKSAKNIRKKAKINIDKIKQIEKKTHHDIVAFVLNLSRSIGEDSQYIHKGITSSDILDTTLAWQIKDSAGIILKDLDGVLAQVKKNALKYKNTVCVARTHGVHAEVYSFGLKFVYLYNDLNYEYKLLKNSLDYACRGKVSGAVGTYAHISPKVEEYVCRKLGIKPAKVSTQIVSREGIAYFLSILGLIASTIERAATEIRHLHRTEVEEVEEPFYKGQKGSSAMPHKKNPIICERLCGLSRLIRANMLASFENINLWHERDISHSSAERVILPDTTIALDYMLIKFLEVLKGLRIDSKNMLNNLGKNKGIIYSQRILVSLMDKGIARQSAYDLVQSVALEAKEKKLSFKDAVGRDKKINKFFSQKEIEDFFNPAYYLRNINSIYKKSGIA